MEDNLTTVDNAIDFRDVVMTLDREDHKRRIYARRAGTEQIYEIIPRHVDLFQKITFDDLFLSNHPPIYMEDMAQALNGVEQGTLILDVFTR